MGSLPKRRQAGVAEPRRAQVFEPGQACMLPFKTYEDGISFPGVVLFGHQIYEKFPE